METYKNTDPLEEYKEKYKEYKEISTPKKISLKGFWIGFNNTLAFFAFPFPFTIALLFLAVCPFAYAFGFWDSIGHIFGFFSVWAILGLLFVVFILYPIRVVAIQGWYYDIPDSDSLFYI